MPQYNWGVFFSKLHEKVNFHMGKGGVTFDCDHTLNKSEEICKELKANWTLVKHDIESFGGYCDCEVLFNAAEEIPHDRRLPQFDLDTGDLLYQR